MAGKNYLTSGEFANAIGVSVSTLHSWRQQGLLEPALVTPSRRMLFTREQADEFNAGCSCRKEEEGRDDMKVYVDESENIMGYGAADKESNFKISRGLQPEGTENASTGAETG